MNHLSQLKKTGKSSSFRKIALATAIFLSFSSNTNAQFVDYSALAQRIVIMGKEIAEYQAQLQQLKQQYDNLQKNLIPGGGLSFNPIKQQDSFKRIADDAGMDVACPGAGSMSLSALASAFSINLDGDIKEAQKQICQRTLLAQNAQYNESVKILEGVREREIELRKISLERIGIKDEPGKLQDNTNKLNAVLNKATIEMQYSTAVIAAYDSYISGLQRTQAQLGKQALTGKNGSDTFADVVVRKFVQGAVLKTALDGVADRDR